MTEEARIYDEDSLSISSSGKTGQLQVKFNEIRKLKNSSEIRTL